MLKTITLLTALLLPAVAAEAKLKVVTTAPDFADLARQIGGDLVEAHSVMRGPENVHNVMAKPTEMVKLNQADLFVHTGLDAEPWRDNLLKGARNPRVLPGKPGNVDMSDGVELKDVPVGRVDRSMGDQHAYGNPHYTLSGDHAGRMVVTLVRAMAAADPANADAYRANAKAVIASIADAQREARAMLAPYRGMKVYAFHDAWDYLADGLGITVAGTIEPQPGITPSAAQVRQVIERMKADDARVVIVETYSDQDLARRVAEAAGAQVVVLPDHVNGVPEADTYQNLLRYNARRLAEAARAAGVTATGAADAAGATRSPGGEKADDAARGG